MSTNHVTARPLSELRDALHRVRIDRDLTYERLSAQIGVSRRALFKFMNEPDAGVQDRWLGKIVRFLDRAEAA